MRDTEISCERGIVMVEERTENQELMAALDNIQGELKGIKKKGAKQVFQIIVAVILTRRDAERAGEAEHRYL